MTNPKRESWLQTCKVYLRPESLRMLFLGFSAGLPLVLLLGTLTLRLSQAQVNIAAIGFASWVSLVYAFKWVWSPFVDRMPIPLLTRWLGRRRSWMLLAQIGIAAGLFGMAYADVQTDLGVLVIYALLVAFSSATQDIALDAYRIESAESKVQSVLSATYSIGYRFAMIWAGAGALWVVSVMRQAPTGTYDVHAWQVAYLVMAASAVVGIVTVLVSPEPSEPESLLTKVDVDSLGSQSKKSIWQRLQVWVCTAVIAPFADFLQRYQRQAVIVLGLIAVYRISDMLMGGMSSPFYNAMGYTEAQIATASKVFGLIMTLLGGLVGGLLVMRVGVFRILFLGALLSAATNLLFALLAVCGDDLHILDMAFHLGSLSIAIDGKVLALMLVISADNLSGGIASAAFVGYLSSLTNIEFSATQYALFTSLTQLLPKLLGGFSGLFISATNSGMPIEASSFSLFFICTALIGIPALVLVVLASKVHERSPVIPLNTTKTSS